MGMSEYTLFSVMGLEIEYMLVEANTLAISPKSDLILKALSDEDNFDEVKLGNMALSNELVMHVLELKNNGPVAPFAPIASFFQNALHAIEPLLTQHNLRLLPSGAHPWMNPFTETKRWPYGQKDIYQQYDTIFNCQGHGWSNLQSMHINLPFISDEDFAKLHNAIRLILPILPALSASSPFLEGVLTGKLSNRLAFYQTNQQRIPLITGDIIPEFVDSELAYQHQILQPMYQAIAPFDPKGLLQHEWLNSRGAIAKFAQKAIEIRLLDAQECVQADIAIAKAIFAILKHWQNKPYFLEHPCPTQRLKTLYDKNLLYGFQAPIDDAELFRQWQLAPLSNCRQVWAKLIEQISHELDRDSQLALEHILRFGSLSERLIKSYNRMNAPYKLFDLYNKLADCLTNNSLFV